MPESVLFFNIGNEGFCCAFARRHTKKFMNKQMTGNRMSTDFVCKFTANSLQGIVIKTVLQFKENKKSKLSFWI